MKFSGVITYDQSKVHAKSQGQRSKVNVTEVTTQLNRFRTVTPVWIHIWWWNDAYSLMLLRRGSLLFFKVIRQISRSHGSKNRLIWPRLGVSGLYLQIGITDGYEMMHKAWSSIEEVSYCFSRSSVKFQGHTALKIFEFDPDWAFPDCNSSLNSPMAMKCCTKLETAKERCPIFQGHPANFKVTRDKTSLIFTQIGRFRIISQSQLSNPSDLPCSRSFFFHWISRSHGAKNRRFWPELSISGQQLQFEFTEGFEMMHKAWCNVQEVPYNISRSSIKFQGHMAEKSMIWIQFE